MDTTQDNSTPPVEILVEHDSFHSDVRMVEPIVSATCRSSPFGPQREPLKPKLGTDFRVGPNCYTLKW
jgi:hypothetical protein